jgi:hypothetical protein
MVERSVHPPCTFHHLTPLLRLILKMTKTMKKAEKRVQMMSEDYLKSSLASFFVLDDKGEKRRLKLQGSASSVSVLSGKIGLSSFTNWSIGLVQIEPLFLLFLLCYV